MPDQPPAGGPLESPAVVIPTAEFRSVRHPLIMTVKRFLRAVRDQSKRASDRALHGVRHRAARAAASRLTGARSILVVCHGNICRSPYGEAALRRDLDGTGMHVESAGFIGPGRQPPANALQAAASRGIDMTDHRSQMLEPELVRSADIILTMDAAQARSICERFGKPASQIFLLGDFDPGTPAQRTIPDPVEMPVEVFDAVYTRIDQCTAVLARTVANGARSGAAQSQ